MQHLKGITGVWILLFFLFLPFPYMVAFNFGEWFSGMLEPLIRMTGQWSGVTSDTPLALHSDSIYLYIQLFILIFPAIGLHFLIILFKKIPRETYRLFLHTAISYILTFFLLKYGFDKLFKYQFYDAEPNILFTPAGYLSKDILFWTSMGSSYGYNVFMGAIEVIPGLLLLYRKTRFAGALIASGVLLNVLAINLGFDITVKILSTLLFLSSIYVLSAYRRPLGTLLLSERWSGYALPGPLMTNSATKRFLKGGIISLILIECLFPYVQSGSFNGDLAPKPAHSGTYSVRHIDGKSTLLDLESIRRIHVHSKGFVILETHDGEFKDYEVNIATKGEFIRFKDYDLELSVYTTGNRTYFTHATQLNNFSIATEKTDLSKLPLTKDSFHWTLEGFTEE